MEPLIMSIDKELNALYNTNTIQYKILYSQETAGEVWGNLKNW